LLRVEALKVEEMIKRSFSENAAQKLAPEQQRQVALVSCCPLGYENEADIQTEKQLAKLPKVDCKVCSADIGAFYDLSAEVVRVNATLIKQAAFAAGAKLLNPGRIVVLRDGVGHPVFTLGAATDEIALPRQSGRRTPQCTQHHSGRHQVRRQGILGAGASQQGYQVW
jgi:antiviral helicase SKI2